MANTWITYNIQLKLAEISKNKELIDWTYLNKTYNENFREIVEHLYPGKQERAMLLNPGSYIWNIVWDKIKNFVWSPIIDPSLNINFDIVVESILTRWEILLKYVNDWAWEWTLQPVRAETYWEDWGKEKIARIYQVYNETLIKWIAPTNYLYVQTYDGRVLTNELFKLGATDFLSQWDPVPLDTVYELSKLPKVQIIENMPRLVEVLDVSDIPLMRTIKSIMYSIDRKLAEAEKHFNDYSEQFKLFQNIEIPKNAIESVDWGKVINWDKLWKVVRTQDDLWVWDIKIIKNWNELLDKALERVDKQIRQVSAITDIPLEYFGFDTTRDSWSWKEVWNANLFKRIQWYRDKIEKTLINCYNFLDKNNSSTIDRSIIWPAIIKMSEADILNKQVIMVQNHLTSLKKAIMAAHNCSEKTAEEILEEIKQDQTDWLLVSLKEANQNADWLSKTNNVLK